MGVVIGGALGLLGGLYAAGHVMYNLARMHWGEWRRHAHRHH